MLEVELFKSQAERIEKLLPIVEANEKLSIEITGTLEVLAKVTEALGNSESNNINSKLLADAFKAVLDLNQNLIIHLKAISKYSKEELNMYNELKDSLMAQGILK
ncbi:MAG: hypothetical protein K9H61_02365 [Bacteroidia bacterium]|nr:hypothetical protein [Bacteroidia bacterium]MCF8445815.1 hypothetical protein [Bacteroidia bacterium]